MNFASERPQILAFEPDETNATLITMIFKGTADVHLAPTAKEGLRMLSTVGNIDIILIEMNLPDMSGYDLFANLRETVRERIIAVIGYTTLFDKENQLKAKGMGFQGYLIKPCDPGELMRYVGYYHEAVLIGRQGKESGDAKLVESFFTMQS